MNTDGGGLGGRKGSRDGRSQDGRSRDRRLRDGQSRGAVAAPPHSPGHDNDKVQHIPPI